MIDAKSNTSKAQHGAMVKNWATYMRALGGLRMPADTRARTPFLNHAWVYAAAMTRALNLSQAPFGIFTETDEAATARRTQFVRKAKSAGRDWKNYRPNRGSKRQAIQRYLVKAQNPARFAGFKTKALEQDFDHPLSALLNKPNAAMTGSMMWQLTEIWMALRGEAFWIKVGNDPEQPLRPNEMPSQLWVVSPDSMQEVKLGNRHVGWRLSVNSDMTTLISSQGVTQMTFRLDEVVQFKYVNPFDPVRGLSPLTAAAMSIDLDLQAKALNRAMLTEGSKPGDILTFEGELDEDEEEDARDKWEKRHKGSQNANRVAILQGTWKHMATGMTPQDMQYIEMLRWDRDEILAIMRTPKTVIGITDDINFATQRGQDKNFWDKGLLPEVRLFEDTIDQELLFNEPDNVVGMFDLSNVEALREGLGDQIEQAVKLSSQTLHMPPRTAFELVGLSGVPEYPGDEDAFVSPIAAVPVETVLAGVDLFGQSTDETGDEDDRTDPNTQDDPDAQEPVEVPEDNDEDVVANAFSPEAMEATKNVMAKVMTDRKMKAIGGKFWQRFIAMQQQAELLGRRQWSGWTRAERRIQLAHFDDVTKRNIKELYNVIKADPNLPLPDDILLNELLTPLKNMQGRLAAAYRPVYTASLGLSFELVTEEVGGVPIFELDDPAITRAFQIRERRLVGTAPRTIQRNLRRSLAQGLRQGDTLNELRLRVNQTYTVTQSPAKTLQVARTETAGFMNDAREEMFKLQGVEQMRWITAGDENVRQSHVFLGSLSEEPIGFNYSSAKGFPGDTSGTLEFPGDARGPASEVINCRCVKIATG